MADYMPIVSGSKDMTKGGKMSQSQLVEFEEDDWCCCHCGRKPQSLEEGLLRPDRCPECGSEFIATSPVVCDKDMGDHLL